MTCPRCLGERFKNEWCVSMRVGNSLVLIPKRLMCWRCKGTGKIKDT